MSEPRPWSLKYVQRETVWRLVPRDGVAPWLHTATRGLALDIIAQWQVGENIVSGIADFLCPVCGGKVKHEANYIEHTLCESYYTCQDCTLYRTEWAYGCGAAYIGWGLIHGHWSDTAGQYAERKAQEKALEEEAKRLWSDQRWRSFGDPRNFDDDTSWAALADWLEENDYALNAKAIRERIAENDRARSG